MHKRNATRYVLVCVQSKVKCEGSRGIDNTEIVHENCATFRTTLVLKLDWVYRIGSVEVVG